jgi:heme/copper-type cytochrome/quinol oxidase subunit 2
MAPNMHTRVIAGVVLIVVGVAGLAYIGSRVWSSGGNRAWGGPMVRGPELPGPRHGARDRRLAPIAGARAVEIAATDTACTPSEISVKAGEAVNVTVANRGTTPRYLVIPGHRIRLMVPPGQTVTTGFTTTVVGKHEFYCGAPGRPEDRTIGRITVTP